jgi:hypothetical protein
MVPMPPQLSPVLPPSPPDGALVDRWVSAGAGVAVSSTSSASATAMIAPA